MGLFSFLTGGKKDKATKAAPVKAAAAPAAKVTLTEAKAEAALKAAGVAPAAVVAKIEVKPATGMAQAKLRLKLAAARRAGAYADAYEAAKGLADIQAKAGRRVGVRVWMLEAEKIRAGMAA